MSTVDNERSPEPPQPSSSPSARPDGAPSGHAHGSPHVVMDEAFWEERYRSARSIWSGNPNPQLVAEASPLAPGRALDVGCGEGADAIWLATQGWQVTAVDFSTVALERGSARARDVGPQIADRIAWLHADLLHWVPAAEEYDLVSAQFMHLPVEDRKALYRRLADSVAPGGSLLVVGHHPADMATSMPRHRAPEFYFTAEELAAELDADRWEIVVAAARPRTVVDPEGNSVVIHDAVLHARRRASA